MSRKLSAVHGVVYVLYDTLRSVYVSNLAGSESEWSCDVAFAYQFLHKQLAVQVQKSMIQWFDGVKVQQVRVDTTYKRVDQ